MTRTDWTHVEIPALSEQALLGPLLGHNMPLLKEAAE
jgi:hypothetical protein